MMRAAFLYDKIDSIAFLDIEDLILQMPETRKEKVLRLKFEKDRLRSLLAGLLLKEGLSEFGADDSSFGYEESGKPVLKKYPELFLSITHSGEYAAVLISDTPAGIDIQEHKGMKESMMRHIVHENEKPVYGVEMLYDLFSKKEAMIKVHGFDKRISDMDTTNPPEGYGFKSIPLQGHSFVVYGVEKLILSSSFSPAFSSMIHNP